MRSRCFRRVLWSAALQGCLLFVGLLLTPNLAAAKGDKISELYRASTGSVDSAASAAIDIKIHRISTDADEETLVQALKAEGSKGLFRELTKQKKTRCSNASKSSSMSPMRRGRVATRPSMSFMV